MSKYDQFLGRARRDVVESVVARRSGHLCSSLSVIDILAVLLRREWDPEASKLRSDVILSKGHAAPALYAVLSRLDESLPPLVGNLRRFGSPYEGHPSSRALEGVQVSTGSLGLGLAWGVGRAIGLSKTGRLRRVTVVASDGELQCGVSYEALRLAVQEQLGLFTLIVDHNGWQTDGALREDPSVLLNALGLRVWEFDGHDCGAIEGALDMAHSGAPTDRPVAIVGRTRRCAGLGPALEQGPEIYGESIDDELAGYLLTLTDKWVGE